MNDDDLLLASAALDGAVTDEERARAAADVDIAGEIERLAAVRAAVAATPPPDAGRRDAAITAALAAFAVPVAPAIPLTAARRRRWLVPATAAAAVVALGVGALVAGQPGRDGDGDDSAAVVADATEAAAERATAAAETLAAPRTAAPPAAAGAESEDAATDTTTATAEATESLSQAVDAAADAATVVVLASPDELRTFAASAPPFGADEAASPRCELGRWVGVARYVVSGTEHDVEVHVVGDEVVAIDATTCEIVARARN